MGENTRALWAGEQAALFDRVSGGPEQAATRRKYAAAALARGGEEFRAVLERQGALHDATVVSLLALQGERLNVRAAL